MRHTVSFTSTAERAPASKVSPHRSARGVLTEVITFQLAQRKNPASPRYAVSTIVPRSNPTVSPFTAAPASAGVSTPAATISTAPRSAAAGRSSESPGRRPHTAR